MEGKGIIGSGRIEFEFSLTNVRVADCAELGLYLYYTSGLASCIVSARSTCDDLNH